MKKIMLLFLFISISAFTFVHAQSIDLGIGGGLTLVQSPAAYTDYYGFSSEYHIGIKGRLNFPLLPITPYGFIDYHFFRGTASGIVTIPENPPIENADTKQNLLSIGVGAELSLVPGPISPYLGLDFEYNNFGDLTYGSYTSAGNSRSGIGIGAGVLFKLLPMVNVDASLKYQMLNLFGKTDGEDTIGIINLNLALFF
jgi:opacity protein-like surface antigen